MIHRLKWKKLWMLSPPEDDVKVRGICWRPDEKLIAIAYSTGKVMILDIENKEEVYSTQHSADITCLHWTQNTKDLLLDDEIQLIDGHKTFLPQMPNLNSLSSTAKKQDFNILKFYSKKSFNLLMVGLANGIVDISVFGTLPCAKINVLEHLKTNDTTIRIRDAKMSADFRHLFVLVTKNGQLQMLVLANNVLAKFSVPLLSLAIKHGQILNTMS
jgi:anaphase-promoting complex subunit 4